jgi:glycosyltransferase involved in cell wall biosynthesis
MPGITATIITFNEEARIAEAIASLSCCEEVIVVDCGSTDRTMDIASALGARVIEHRWQGYAGQKNFAAEQASNEWILNIDADERVSIELAAEIVCWKQGDTANPDSPQRNGCHAWSMPRRAFYLGKWIKHSGWYPDRKVRFYDRRHCRFEGDFVHEMVKPKGRVGTFRGDLFHFPYRDFIDHCKRIDRYTELAAQEARSSGRRGSVLKLVVGPAITFSKTFFLRAGFLDGWRGFAIAYMGARYVFQREFRILR